MALVCALIAAVEDGRGTGRMVASARVEVDGDEGPRAGLGAAWWAGEEEGVVGGLDVVSGEGEHDAGVVVLREGEGGGEMGGVEKKEEVVEGCAEGVEHLRVVGGAGAEVGLKGGEGIGGCGGGAEEGEEGGGREVGGGGEP